MYYENNMSIVVAEKRCFESVLSYLLLMSQENQIFLWIIVFSM